MTQPGHNFIPIHHSPNQIRCGEFVSFPASQKSLDLQLTSLLQFQARERLDPGDPPLVFVWSFRVEPDQRKSVGK